MTPIATATMAGLIALELSTPGNVYGFGNDKSQYQQLVKNYYTSGFNRRRPDLHPPGSWYRPGSYAPVAWNRLDGSQSTVCPLTWSPDGVFKKRQTSDPATSADICSGYNSHAVIIYSRVEKSCMTTISTQSQTRPAYRQISATGMALSALSKMQTQPAAPSLSPSPRPQAKMQVKTLNLHMRGLRRKFRAGYRAVA